MEFCSFFVPNLYAEVPAQETTDTVTVVSSRLPYFKVPFADVPANVSYIPANVSQKSREAIYETQPVTLQDSLKSLESSVLYDAVGNGVDTTFSLRGFNESSAIIVLVDGVRVNEVDGNGVVFPLISTSDLESIQVDRGSASPIYGSNAFAGVVHITTGQASEKPVSLFGGFEWSSFDGLRFNQGVSGTLQDNVTPLGGAFKYYFNGGRAVSDGFRDNGETRITNFDIKSSYEWEDRGRIHFGLKHVDDAISNPGELTFDQFQADPDKSNKPLDGRDFRNTILQLGGDVSFWDGHISASLLMSQRVRLAHSYLTSGTFTDFADGFNPDTDLVTEKSRQSSLIWQLAYQDEWDEIKNLSTIGMEMVDTSQYALRQDAFGGNVVETTLRETERASEDWNVALYWRETLEFFDKIIAHVGMRHDFFHLKTRDDLNSANDLKQSWDNSSISTGVTFQPHEAVDVFANYSQGFRVPTISELAPFASGINRNLEPEQSDSYEVGTRIRLKDKGLLKFSYFLIDLEDEIVFDSTSRTVATPFGRNINVGASRRMGVETRVDLKPIDEVSLYGSHTWTKAYIRETDGAGVLADDRSLGQIPEHRLTWGLTVQPFANAEEELLQGFSAGLYGVFTGKQHPTSFESASQATLNATGGAGHIIKSYTLWDFIMSYDYKGKKVFFKINNVFDNKYYSRSVSATSFGTAIYPAGTFNFVNPGAPREFVLGASWEFCLSADQRRTQRRRMQTNYETD